MSTLAERNAERRARHGMGDSGRGRGSSGGGGGFDIVEFVTGRRGGDLRLRDVPRALDTIGDTFEEADRTRGRFGAARDGHYGDREYYRSGSRAAREEGRYYDTRGRADLARDAYEDGYVAGRPRYSDVRGDREDIGGRRRDRDDRGRDRDDRGRGGRDDDANPVLRDTVFSLVHAVTGTDAERAANSARYREGVGALMAQGQGGMITVDEPFSININGRTVRIAAGHYTPEALTNNLLESLNASAEVASQIRNAIGIGNGTPPAQPGATPDQPAQPTPQPTPDGTSPAQPATTGGQSGPGQDGIVVSSGAAARNYGATGMPRISDNQVRDVQEFLEAQGYRLPQHGADGKWGRETQVAFEAYCRERGITDPSSIDFTNPESVAAFQSAQRPAPASPQAGPAPQPTPATDQPAADQPAAEEGQQAPLSAMVRNEVNHFDGISNAAVSDTQTVDAVRSQLAGLGFATGTDAQFTQAVRNVETALGVQVDGRADEQLFAAIRDPEMQAAIRGLASAGAGGASHQAEASGPGSSPAGAMPDDLRGLV